MIIIRSTGHPPDFALVAGIMAIQLRTPGVPGGGLVLPWLVCERVQPHGVSAVGSGAALEAVLKEVGYEVGRRLGIGKKGPPGKEAACARGMTESDTKGFCKGCVCACVRTSVWACVCYVHCVRSSITASWFGLSTGLLPSAHANN